MSRIEDFLALPKSIQSDLASALEAIYTQRYNGPVTFHFRHGVAKTIQMLPPEIRLESPDPDPACVRT